MSRTMIAAAGFAWLALATPGAEAGEGRWNAVGGWMKKLPPDASYSRTTQIGSGNASSTVQLNGGNVSVIYQNGNDNSAQAVQTGRGNVSSIIQLGNSNNAVTEQRGNGSVSSTVQIGDGHLLRNSQSGGGVYSSVQSERHTSKEVKRVEKTAWRSVKDAVKEYRRR